MIPSTFLSIWSWIRVRRQMAADEVMMNVRRIGRSLFQVIYLLILKLIIADVVNARRPESVVASPYEGIRKGSIVIMNMPNPNPVVLWTKLPPKVRRNISRIFSICSAYAPVF